MRDHDQHVMQQDHALWKDLVLKSSKVMLWILTSMAQFIFNKGGPELHHEEDVRYNENLG